MTAKIIEFPSGKKEEVEPRPEYNGEMISKLYAIASWLEAGIHPDKAYPWGGQSGFQSDVSDVAVYLLTMLSDEGRCQAIREAMRIQNRKERGQ